MLVLALDRHELITDMVGHDDRDALLVRVGERLQGAVRPGDQVSHLMGDELWVLVDQIRSPEDTIAIAGRIQQSLARPFDLGSEEMSITAAIGIALSGEGAGGAEDMLKNAATAMRRARARGPSRHEFYDLAMRARERDRLRLETDLRLGVERDEFVVHYQPIVTVRTGAIEGFEALVRWQHPRRGLVPPGQFIPAAEETGLIVPMSVNILRRGCAQIRAWQERFGHTPGHAAFSLSMNFTGTHFSETAVLEVVSTALEQSGLDGSCLVAEVTESILLRDVDTVLAVLDELTRMKVRVHLDDFGTGYSSLSYLHRLPADTLKIDRSFISRLGIDRQTDILVKAIVDLAHNLGKQVIAEGSKRRSRPRSSSSWAVGSDRATTTRAPTTPRLSRRCWTVVPRRATRRTDGHGCPGRVSWAPLEIPSRPRKPALFDLRLSQPWLPLRIRKRGGCVGVPIRHTDLRQTVGVHDVALLDDAAEVQQISRQAIHFVRAETAGRRTGGPDRTGETP